jgi:GntR family transcriptional regulator, transcriptional repressor for pyruvate dehydrogenase complex
MSKASAELFGPVAGGRLAVAIVEQIREAIFSGRLSPGERLPSEREFAKIFGASAVVIREALHALEAAGLVTIRYGTTGGAYVAELTHRPLTESLSTLLRAGKTTIAQITEARLVIEPEVAGFAAIRRRAKRLAPLERNLEETATLLGRIREARLLNLEYHKLLVEITGNPFFIACLCSLIENLEGNTAYMDLNMGAVTDTLEYHRKIFRAVKRGDAAAAATEMRRHIVDIHRRMARAKRTA